MAGGCCTRQQMLAAAAETIKLLGLHEHETVLIAHNDEPHQHIHVIVNRVHPQTGIAAKLSNDHLTLSRWAEDYERRMGRILCHARVFNNAARGRGQFVKDTKSLSKADYQRAQRDREAAKAREQARQRDHNKNLAARHRQQREALRLTREQKIREAREAARERFRPQWRKLYRRQRAERAKLSTVRDAAQERLRYWLNNKDIDRYGGNRETRAGHLSKAWNAMEKTAQRKHSLKTAHDKERRLLGDKQRKEAREQIKEIRQDYKRDLDRLTKTQDHERAAAIKPAPPRARTLRENADDITRRPVTHAKPEKRPAAQSSKPSKPKTATPARPREQELRQNITDITKPRQGPDAAAAQSPAQDRPRARALQENIKDITKPVEQTPEEIVKAFLHPNRQGPDAPSAKKSFAAASQKPQMQDPPAGSQPPPGSPQDERRKSRESFVERLLRTTDEITKASPQQTRQPVSAPDVKKDFAEAAKPEEHEHQSKTKSGDKTPSKEEAPREQEQSERRKAFRDAAAEVTKAPDSEALKEARRRRDELERRQRESSRRGPDRTG